MYYQNTMDFSEWLDRKLKEKGWSRVQAAKRGGVSASMYDKVINDGQPPGRKFVEGVAKAFKMKVSDVWELVTNPSARISEDILLQSQEILNELDEESRRKALENLQRLKEEEARRKRNGVAPNKRSPKPKSS